MAPCPSGMAPIPSSLELCLVYRLCGILLCLEPLCSGLCGICVRHLASVGHSVESPRHLRLVHPKVDGFSAGALCGLCVVPALDAFYELNRSTSGTLETIARTGLASLVVVMVTLGRTFGLAGLGLALSSGFMGQCSDLAIRMGILWASSGLFAKGFFL